MQVESPAGWRWLERRGVLKALAALGCVFFLTAGAITVVRASVPGPSGKLRSSEYHGFRELSRSVVLEGGPQYEDHVRAYPPFFTIAFLPFSLGPKALGSGLFYLVSFAGYGASVWWLCRIACAPRRPSPALALLAWLAPVQLFSDVVLRCETDAVVLTAVAGGLFLILLGGRRFLGGLLLGFAASFKVLPVLFGVFLLCQRRWREALGMAAGGLLFTLLVPTLAWGPQGMVARHLDWFEKVVRPYHAEGAEALGIVIRPSNQSLTAALHRFLRRVGGEKRTQVNIAEIEPETIQSLASLLHLAITIFFIAFWARSRRPTSAGPPEQLTAFATVPVAMLLLSDVSLTTHHLLLLPALTVLLGRYALERPAVGRWVWVVPVFALAMGALASGAVKAVSPMLGATLLVGAACVGLAVRDRRTTTVVPAGATSEEGKTHG